MDVVSQSEEVVRQSPTTVFQLDGNETIWGSDAQEHWQRLGAGSACVRIGDKVLVSSPSAVDTVLHDPERFSSGPDALFLGSKTGLVPLQVDPPGHVRYRRLLDPLFTPRRLAALEAGVAELTNRCLDGFIDRGRCDLSSELAVPVPCGTFLQLMGLPLEGLDEFIERKDDIIRPVGSNQDEVEAKRAAAGRWIYEMYTGELDRRRGAPAGDDVLGHLVAQEEAGELTREESLNISYLLLIAGLDTVTDSIECCFAYLVEHPEHRRRLAAEPELAPRAVEELLRWMNPVPSVVRVVTEDTELEGCPLPKGTRISVLLASANVDGTRFAEPERVDFDRSVTKHVGFGLGIHRCLGSHLARLELRVVLREWHRRIADYRLPDGHVLQWSPALREILSFPLELTARPSTAQGPRLSTR